MEDKNVITVLGNKSQRPVNVLKFDEINSSTNVEFNLNINCLIMMFIFPQKQK